MLEALPTPLLCLSSPSPPTLLTRRLFISSDWSSCHWSLWLPIQPSHPPKQPFFKKKNHTLLLLTDLEWLAMSLAELQLPGTAFRALHRPTPVQPDPCPAFPTVPGSLKISFLHICALLVRALSPDFSSCVILQPFAKLSLTIVPSRKPDVA